VPDRLAGAARGSDDDYCALYPLDGHHYVAHSVDAAPIKWVDRCQLCGHISSRTLRLALAPDASGFVEVSALSGSLVVRHVGACFCGRSPGAQVANVKTLDARCIVAYRVPAVRSPVDGEAALPSEVPSGEGTEVRQPEKPREDKIPHPTGDDGGDGLAWAPPERLITLQEFDD
jgi:hypothetical protein